MLHVSVDFRCPDPRRGTFRLVTQYPEEIDRAFIDERVEREVEYRLSLRCPVTGASFTRDDVTREEWTTDD